MKYFFHPDAEKEFIDTIDYYEKIQEGLGIEFTKEIYKTIQNILLYPKAWTPLSKNTRRCLINRFPFGVIYQIKKNEIYIIEAVPQPV